MGSNLDIVKLTGTVIDPACFGARAARLSALAAEGVAISPSVAVSVDEVAACASDRDRATELAQELCKLLGAGPLSLRASPPDPAWGGPAALLNIGLGDEITQARSEVLGRAFAEAALFRYIADFASLTGAFDSTQLKADPGVSGGAAIAEARALYLAETGDPFPEDPVVQIARALHAMAQSWTSPTARILRTARGAPETAGLGLILQVLEVGPILGSVQAINAATGRGSFEGTFRGTDGSAIAVTDLPKGSKEALFNVIRKASRVQRDAARVKVVINGGDIRVTDHSPASRRARAELQIVVDLVEQGILNREEALLRIDPSNLVVHLHPQVDMETEVDILTTGIAASPGAARGTLVFTAESAQVLAAQKEPAILVRNETSPEDIRGMSTAAGVLTLTGGTTSHAAVIAQGLGVPCVVGAEARIDQAARKLEAPDGRVLREGDEVTLDGTTGRVLIGEVALSQREQSTAFLQLMSWADEIRSIGVRANADTPDDARMAKQFLVDGIGLCRSEHMFYAADRIDVMREMILAEDVSERARALERLLPMQRDDFRELFETMQGAPVTIRLLDPPLHEFLPKGTEEIEALAAAMGLPERTVRRRIAALEEFNPMLGKRGVRLAVTMPEIYAMQARAIFEAAAAAEETLGISLSPEIMIPLVSAQREVELVQDSIRKVALDLSAETGTLPSYRLGVMVETPRAVLRAADLAKNVSFFSFGTNDLTQMTYGLSRDDSSRFMREYVNGQVFAEDPFLTLDVEAVGELLLIATRRGRAANPDLVLGLCGEHGGDPMSIRFCMLAGFDYVSCSPFRVPIARLAAAQAALLTSKRGIDPTVGDPDLVAAGDSL